MEALVHSRVRFSCVPVAVIYIYVDTTIQILASIRCDALSFMYAYERACLITNF